MKNNKKSSGVVYKIVACFLIVCLCLSFVLPLIGSFMSM